MDDHYKLIPGPGWPKSTMGSVVITPEGKRLRGITNVEFRAPSDGKAETVITILDRDLDPKLLPADTVIVREQSTEAPKPRRDMVPVLAWAVAAQGLCLLALALALLVI